MAFIISYDELHVEDYTSFGGDVERSWTGEAEKFDDVDVALARFKELSPKTNINKLNLEMW
jgi:hypothetical protein